jgi:hypothetical protein
VTPNDDRYLEACLPPWQHFPIIIADGLVQQLETPSTGEEPPETPEIPTNQVQQVTEEASHWFDQVWRPFWSGLDWEQRERYLLRWRASVKWRAALVLLKDRITQDPAATISAAKEQLASWRRERARQKKPQLWYRTVSRKR